MEHNKLLVGTSKGLVGFEYKNGELKMSSLDFEGLDVNSIHQHPNGNIYVSISHKHWGCKLYVREHGQEQWRILAVPTFSETHKTVNGQAANLKQIWDIKDGGEKYPDRLWVATEPGAVFISEDMGLSFKMINSLWNHETRMKNKQWFGAGKDLPFVHSLIIDPENNDTIFASVSCAGVFKSMDSGKSWVCMNDGMDASYLPNPNPIAGYDPHLMLATKGKNPIYWQQNHCGIYKTNGQSLKWENVSGENGMPSYGFCIAVDELNGDIAWVIPVEDETKRVPPNFKLQVLKTEDGGKTWIDKSVGLPKDKFFGIVLRNGFVKSGNVLTFGTSNGNVFLSNNGGDSWQRANTDLAKVTYLQFIKN